MNIYISRRAFLATAAAIPGAAILPSGGAPAAPSVMPEPAVAITVPLRPPHPWRWWVTRDEEVYHAEFDTREEAIEYARVNEYPIIAECQRTDFSLKIDADAVMERLADTQYDLMGEDGNFIEYTKEQAGDLSKMLTETMYAWAEKHNIDLTAWAFGRIRNMELVDLPPTAEAAR